ncbi:MAG: hypothetical protein QOE17_2575, partial [Gaiellales bacterium]|nr:hypothetical protein [Gaiellales bacterium]
MAPEPGIGDIVAGYRLDSVVARGGMGTIYRATHERLGTTFALKVLRPELASDPQFRSRFELEARLLAQFHHPNVVQVTNAGEDAGILYMVTTYLEGYALTDLILRAGRLDPALVLDYVSQIASALDAAHESGLVHRDVKPSNILITSASASDPGGKAYLVDFGIAKDVANAGKLTEYGAFVGSRHYASPEQINARPLDGRADQYSLACVFFEAVTGHVPYDRGSEAAVIVAHLTEAPPSLAADRPDLPAALDKALAKALSKDPAERYPTCAAMVEALEQAAGASGEASSAELAELAPGVITAAGKTEVGAGREPPIELPPDMPPPIPAGHETEVGIAQGGPPPQETPDSPAGGDSGGTEVVSRGTPPV